MADDTSLATADLLILQRAAASPSPTTESAYVKNSSETYLRVIHNDQFRTVYLEVRFPRGSLESLDGQALALDDSARVTLAPEPDTYGVTVSPSGLEFAAGAHPYATFRFATYADLSAADASTRYPTRSAYASALALWYESSGGRWERVDGSGFTGNDAVTGRMRQPGRYMVAAPR